MLSEDSLLDVGDIAADESVARQRVCSVIEFPSTDEFIMDMIGIIDPRLDEMMNGGLKKRTEEGVNDKPFCDLGKVAGGILGSIRLSGWTRDKMVEYVVQKSEQRLPPELVQRVVDTNENLLTYVNTRMLPSYLEEIEIYGYTYRIGDGLPELSYLQVCDGYGDFEGLYGLWAMRKDSRAQWEDIAGDLEGRGVERVGSVCVNLASSHVLMEEGFVEAFKETFPDSSPFGITEGMYVS